MVNGLLDFLFSNGLPAIAIAVFVASILLMITRRNTFTRNQRFLLLALMVICLLFFVFLIWVSFGFGGSHPITPPTMP